MERLGGLDGLFLALDTANAGMNIGQVSIFDPSTSPEPYTFERSRRVIEERLHLVPFFRRRAVDVPFGIGTPAWVEDPQFEISRHIHRKVFERDAGLADLSAFAARVLAGPLQKDRPLWEIYLAEGLENGHVAAISKVHHAAIDGVAGVQVMAHLLDLESDPPPVAPPAQAWVPERLPSPARRVGMLTRQLVTRPRAAIQGLTGAAGGAAAVWGLRRIGGPGPPPMPFAAPRVQFSVAMSPTRRTAMTSLSMHELRGVKERFGVTLNDVLLAVCAGALRRVLEPTGDLPDAPLVALMPISVRAEADDGSLGNRVTMALTSLATDEASPIERLAAISRSAARAKDEARALGADLFPMLATLVPPILVRAAVSAFSATHLAQVMRPAFNVVISNVPGPPVPLYSAGARMVANYPFGPLGDGIGLNITTMSYVDRMDFGLITTPETGLDLWSVGVALSDSLRELEKAER